MPPPRFVQPLRAGSLARSDHDVRHRLAAGGRNEAVQVVGRHREIRIRHEAPVAPRLQHATADGSALAAPAAADQANSRVATRALFHDGRGAIRAAVVDDDDLPGKAELLQGRAHLIDARTNAGFLVEGRNDN